MITPALERHLGTWLGRWPARQPIDVVGSASRERPGWDGRVARVVGVRSPEGGVLSVPRHDEPAVMAAVSTVDGWDDLLARVPWLLGADGARVYSGIFRWCEQPVALPDAGVWVDPALAWLPDWLRPFGSVLVARDPDTGEYLAGVGLKHHDAYGQEIAVGTSTRAQGRGLARALVAQAARRVLDEGAVPTYQHDPANVASARVAEAAGFPDRGWRSAGMAG
jgi:GNAT superfamily N-acetyltransferase